LTEPDRIVAARIKAIIAAGDVPATQGNISTPDRPRNGGVAPLGLYNASDLPISEGQPGDDRQWVPLAQSTYFGASAFGGAVGPGGCTLTMIGRWTAVTAAHCIFDPDLPWPGYLPPNTWALGRNATATSSSGSTTSTPYTPFGTFVLDHQNIAIAIYPGWWVNPEGSPQIFTGCRRLG
jgi:V8-like Glu-specific endopeptidase